MMMLSEIAKAVKGNLLGIDTLITSVDSDSRRIEKNQLFVAIKGERFDGNQFAAEAISQGAAAVLISDAQVDVQPAILVNDSRIALGEFARYWRAKITAPVIAITGSNGKTTTKEMLSAILTESVGNAQKIHATYGNFNNDIGLPLTLLKVRHQHEYIVLEMGMNHMGEIDYLTHIAKPNVALVINAGTAHIGELGSRENIAKAKGEIFSGLNQGGTAIINADDAFAPYWQSINAHRNMMTFSLKKNLENKSVDVTASYQEFADCTHLNLTTPNGSVEFKLNLLGQHNVYNALAACTAAVALGVSNAAIAKGLSSFRGVNGRLQHKLGFNGAMLIDDTYNANPDSMKAAINVLVNKTKDSIFVMGDMGELGDDATKMHAEIGSYAKQKGISRLLAFGENSQQAVLAFGDNAQHFTEISTLEKYIKSLMRKEVTVLVKGSRFMRMERLVEMLQVAQTENNQQNKDCAQCC